MGIMQALGAKSALRRGAPKGEREALWRITHVLSLLLGRDLPDGVSNHAQTTRRPEMAVKSACCHRI